MDSFGLPMSFGKKAKAGPVNVKARVDTTKRAEPAAPSGAKNSEPEPSAPIPAVASPTREKADARVSNGGQDEEEDNIGPSLPRAGPSTGEKRKADEPAVEDDDDEEDEDDLGIEEEEEVDRTPISHEIILKDHTKVCSALAIDPPGARFASGSHDYDTKLWDFGGMDSRLRPFKSFEANGNYHVHDLSFSADGKKLLVVSGTFFPKVYDKEGDKESA